MQKEEMIEVLSEIHRNVVTESIDKGYVDVTIDDPMSDGATSFYRYKVMEDGYIQIEKWIGEEYISSTKKTFREIVWKSCNLEQVCNIYIKQYTMWKEENSGIPYIETKINDEADGKMEMAFEFMRNFWLEKVEGNNEGTGNLRLLLAEYGVGKSSFCQGVRQLAAEEIRDSFFSDGAAYPFVFDLNNFRSGDFDKFIESELFGKYKLPLVYRTFEKLCQAGIFMVVLDAWDQMRSTRQLPFINQDLNEMSSLWENKGHVLITCRRSFYQQQLKEKGKLSQVGLYKLNGFDKGSAIDYFLKNEEERLQRKQTPLVEHVSEWVSKCWQLNSELFAKPLNLRLLVKHFQTISKEINFAVEKADTYKFLEIVLLDWKKKNDIEDLSFLKQLVSKTLSSGLNRSISLRQFRKSCADIWENIYIALKEFDFVKIDDKGERIEFCLAAFQEFLWACFVVEELKMNPEQLDNENALIRNYLLIREVREWICKRLGIEESNCLKEQLTYVKFKAKEEVGYRGSNSLTLLCDLNRIPFYNKQLEEVKTDLGRRPLRGTDFRGMDLSGFNFYGSNLEGADFSFTKLNDVKFCGTDLANTEWREHGSMKKCAFLNQSDVLCLVAGTQNGGVLTYCIDDGEQEIMDLQNDVINDLAGDRGGIYTASSDGWVGYIDKNGNLRNAYIAQSGLQSIAHTRNESCIYVGADNREIYRYNWKSVSKQKIEIDQILGSESDTISDIHYYSNSKNEDYIAYTLSNKRLLILVKLKGMFDGEVAAQGIISTKNLQFSDICFAADQLIYSIVGKGVFGISVEEAVGNISEEELLNDQQEILSFPEATAFSLGWANHTNTLLVAAKIDEVEINNIYKVDLSLGDKEGRLVELDWFYNNHRIIAEQVEGFSVSDDEEYIAFAGKKLVVFKNMGEYYELFSAPIEAKISCKNANFTGCTGIYKELKEFLKSRGAIGLDEEEYY